MNRAGFSIAPSAQELEPPANPERLIWKGDVLDESIAQVLAAKLDLVTDLLVDRTGYRDPARLGEALEPGRDVDAVTVEIIAIDDRIADCNAYSRLEALVAGQAGIAFRRVALDIDRVTSACGA